MRKTKKSAEIKKVARVSPVEVGELPSMLMAIPFSISTPVNAEPVNCLGLC